MTDKGRFSVSLNPELAEMVNEYRFRHRITTQNKAIQQLLEMSFQSMDENKKSGLTNETELTSQEHELIRIARELDPSRQALLLRLASAVAEKDSPRMQ